MFFAFCLSVAAAVVWSGLRGQPPVFVKPVDRTPPGRIAGPHLAEPAPDVPREISLLEARDLVARGQTLPIDVREPLFFDAGHLPGAVNLPLSRLTDVHGEILGRMDPGTPLLVYCSDAGCGDAAKAARALRQRGHREVSVIRGGWQEWEAAAGRSAP